MQNLLPLFFCILSLNLFKEIVEILPQKHLYFKGKELQYKDRNLVYNGRVLEPYLQIKAMETADTASSFLYIISFLHILHIAVALIYLLRLTIHSFSGKFSASENLSLRVGGIFWHFLGLLWAYLLLFLIFIH